MHEHTHVDRCLSTRRGFLRLAGAGAGLALASTAPWSTRWARADQAPAPNALSGDEALKRLVDGNARYVRGELEIKDFAASRASLARGQSPHSVILSCSDSRVAPELAFDQGRGDLFVVRLAGNSLTPAGLASIEYAVEFLGSSLILVLGHTSCGAIEAAIKVVKEDAKLPGHLPELIDDLRPAVVAAQKQSGDLLVNATRTNVAMTVAAMIAAKPIVSEKVAAGKVKVAGGIYDLSTGKVELLS